MPEPHTLTELLRRRAELRPGRPAYTFLADGEADEARATYGELHARALAVGASLARAGATGGRVMLLYPPGLDYAAAFFGCLYAGAVAVPAYPPRANRTLDRIEAIAADAGADFALTTAKLLPKARAHSEGSPALGRLRWLSSEELEAEAPGGWEPAEPAPDSLAYLQYTSGSTSTPKGVMISHANVLHNAAYIHEGFEHTPESVSLTWLPHFHDMGLVDGLIVPLFGGFHAYLMPPAVFLQQPARWLRAVTRLGVTHTGGPNFAYELCLRRVGADERAGLDLRTWSVAYNGAEPVLAETLERFAEAFAPCGFRREVFYPAYGLAEATLKVTGGRRAEPPALCAVRAEALKLNRVVEAAAGDAEARTLVGSGRASSGTRVEIVEPETHAVCAESAVGEIWVASPSVAGGYWRRPEESAQTFGARLAETGEGPFLRTGDLGFVRDGELFVTGRLKDVVIIRGLNHYPQDIERTMEASHPALRPGCGAAFPVEAGGEERLVLVQEVERAPQADPEEVIAAVRRAVGEGHEVQAHAVVLVRPHTVPKTSSGKIQRHACRARYLEGSLEVVAAWREASPEASASAGDSAGEASAPPSEPEEVEDWLAARVAARLGARPAELERDAPIAHFGLDSLSAIELTHEVESELGVRLPMASFLQDFSIAQLAARLAAGDEGEPLGPWTFEPDEDADRHPLSYGQRAMWFLHRLAPESPAYNIPVAVRVPGELDAAALRRAFESLVARHASLRATFHDPADGGEPFQRVHERAAFDFSEVDATHWSERLLHGGLVAEAHRSFDLGAGPVLRVALFERSPRERVMLLVVHHIVADFWSLATLMRELGAFYEEETGGRAAAPAPLALRYTDYARWQAAAMAGREGERLSAFWEGRLAGEPPRLDLPTDRPRPPVQTFNGASHTVRLGAELTRRVKELGRARGATLYMTLLAAFEALLYRYTGQEDFAVGSPTSGRGHSKLTDVVGYFVNPLALRADLSGDPTFEELLGRVRRTVLSAFEHQDYPFPLLVERLQPSRDPSFSPLFQVMFILQKAHSRNAAGIASLALGEAGARVELGGLAVESLSLEQRVAQFDLTLMAVEEEDGGLAASLQYNTDLFDAATAERMAGHFRAALERLVREPSRRLSRLPLLTEEEERRQLVEWNDTAAPYPSEETIHGLFERQARRTPDALALVFEGERLTYAELDARANRLARHLRRAGVGPESRVGVLLERSTELVVSLLAVLKAGAAYVPLDPEYPRERLTFMAEDAGLAALVTKGRLTELAGALGVAAPVLSLDARRAEIEAESGEGLGASATPDNLAYVIYTSGSTGRPKGAMLAHRGVVNRLQWMQDAYGLTADDRVLQKTPYSFDVSVWEFFWPLMYGATLVVARPRGHQDSAYLVRVIADEGVTTLHFVPSMLQVFLREKGLGRLDGLRRVICSGEALPVETQERFFASLGCELHNLYGPTEASIDVTYWACERESARRSVPIGRPIANTRVYVLDRGMEPVPVGVGGELYLGGVALARGYHARPALTAERFVPDPFSGEPGARLYRTGDLVRQLAGGEIEFLGRLDNQVKVRGFRVELGEIEAALAGREGVRQCVVAAREAGPGDQRLVAYVVADREQFNPAGARRALRELLPEHMTPSAFVLLDEMPLTPSGKVDRRRLPAPEQEAGECGATESPCTPVEEVLANIWEQALGAHDVGVQDNFFELGGHSLLAMQVVSRLNDAFGTEAPLHVLFESPTVAALAGQVESLLAGGETRAHAPVTRAARPSSDEVGPPLSYQQRRLWFLAQLEPGDPSYNMAGALRLKGRLDADALAWGFEQVVGRHEVLRTAFVEADGEPSQAVRARPRVALPLIDLSGLAEGERGPRLEALLREEAERPFDLTRCPLLRARLLRLGEEEHVLQLTMHHIVSDGWSLGVLLRELKTFYDSRLRGRQAGLPELPVQYSDFAYWQRERFEAGELERQLDYWEGRLSGLPEALELPTDRPRRPAPARRGGVVELTLPSSLTSALKAASRREGATLFMMLLAGFEALLYRHTGQESFAVGTPVAGRGREEVRDLIGFFVNTLALRADVSGEMTFSELVGRVRAEALGAYQHQEAPFERVVERLRPARVLDRSPLFQVMLSLDNTPQEALVMGGLAAERVELRGAAAKFDLSLSLREEDGRLAGALSYDADLFDEATIARMAERYALLLEGAAADPSLRVSRLPVLSEEEERRLLVEWNDTRREYPRDATLHGLFERQAARTPRAVALVFEGGRLTYAELDGRAERLARRLRRAGVGPESRVGLCVERSSEMFVGLLGVLKAGGAYVPLDPEYPAERLSFMAADAGLALVLTQEGLSARVEGWGAGVPVLSIEGLEGEDAGDEPEGAEGVAATPDNLAYVIYTSGSTGRPKGVCVTHRAVCNHLLWRQEAYPLGAGDRFLHKASISFDIGTWEIFAPLVAGACSVAAAHGGQQDAAYLVRLMAAERVTVAHFGPAMLRAVVDEPGLEACAGLRQVFCGGEPLTPELQARFHARAGARLTQQYGPTEATIDVTAWDCREGDARGRVPIGRPIANARAYVLDAALRPAPVGVAGELCVGGVALARNYHARPALTAERFVPDPFSGEPGARLYRTGDVARWLGDGNLEFVGRLDNQVKVRGYRVELGEVEAALAERQGVRECVVAAAADDAGESRLVAYITCEEGETLVVADLRRALRERLPEHMLPSAFVLLDEMPLTPSGKVDRRRLPAPGDATRLTAGASEPPRTPAEELLAGMWEELLGTGRVGATDDFFELGGHSLLATRLVARVRDRLGVELALRKVFERPTVRALAEEVEAALGVGGVAAPERIERRAGEGAARLSYAQQRLWFLDQLEPCNAAYNMSAAASMSGPLDARALEGALTEIVRRHEVLRTTFRMDGDAPAQVVGPAEPFTIPVTDLSTLPDAGREAEVERLTREEAERPFDLARGPLLRASLLRLGEEQHVLLFTMHHIVSDAWSVDVLGRELAALYDALAAGRPASLPELPVQYADFAEWQRGWLRGELLEGQLAYWRGRLGDAPAALALPTDRPRPAVQSYRGARVPFRVPPRALRELKRVSRQHGATLFMTLLAGLKTLLGRYANQDDVVVGTPVAGRSRAEVEPLVGFFANTLALRTDLSGDPSFAGLLGRVRETALGAYAHGDAPFEMLVEELRPERDLSRHPLFQVMLVVQHERDAALSLRGLESSLLRTASETSKFDLLVSLEESGEGLDGVLEHSADLFDEGTARRMAAHFVTLLEAAAERPESRLSELPLLGAEERAALLALSRGDGAGGARVECLHKVFESRAAASPDAPAVAFGAERVGYGELNRRANRLAHALRRLGVGRGSRVGLCAVRSVEMVVGLLGVLKAGAAYVPLDPEYPGERLSLMLADADVPVVVTQPGVAGRLPRREGVTLVHVGEAIAGGGAEDAADDGARETDPESGVTADDLAYVLYTSGSTGVPKGVALGHGALANLVGWQLAHAPLGGGARTLQFASLNFDVSFQEIFSTLCEGGELLLVSEEERRDPARLLSIVEREGVARLYLPFVALRELAEAAAESGAAPGALRQVFTAGEQLQVTPAVAQFFGRLPGCKLFNHYGPSETHVVTSHELRGEPSSWPPLPPIGRPVASTQAYVLDRRMEPVPAGVAGELYLGGAALARGYHARPALTAERFVPDPFSREPGARLYRTGDLARWLGDGELEFLGRADNQVKVRGYRVELGEVEAALGECRGVRQAVVLAREWGGGGGLRLVAYVMPEDAGAAPTARELREELRRRLPEHMTPSAFVFVDEWPLTPSGKVDRRRLPAPDASATTQGASEPPRTPTEELLAGMWEELLGVGRVGATDDFFELGGHSLLATRLVARARERFGVELALRKVFERPTVRALAEEVEAALAGGAGAGGGRIERRAGAGGTAPLSYAQRRLWFLDQLEPGQSAYNLASATRLRGALDVAALERSFNEVARRHESLRTTFRNEGGEPAAVVSPHGFTPLEARDLSALGDGARDAELKRLLDAEAREPFDLGRGPLWRARLLRLGEGEHVLLFTMHHIISDGWSLGVLVREVAACYEAFAAGSAPTLPEPPVQYADFAEWQRERFEGGELERQLGYWEERLAALPEALELPIDRPRRPVSTRRGGVVELTLQPALTSALKAASRREGATLFMTLLAGFEALLYRHTGQESFAVGTPVAGRSREEVRDVIGFFVNTLALRADVSGEMTFSELVGRVRAEALGAYAHQEAPFERVVERLRPARALDRSPLFQVMLALDNTPHEEARLGGLSVERLPLDVGGAKYDLSLSLREEDGGLAGALSYDADLFDEATITRMAERYALLLEGAAAEPALTVSRLPVLSEEEERRLLVEWNDTAAPFPADLCVHELFARQARLTPDALAVAHGERRLTYAELDGQADRLARHLRRAGVGPESRVGVLLERSPELIVALLGVLKAGAAYVPLDPEYPRERLTFMAEDAGLAALVTRSGLAGGASAVGAAAVVRIDEPGEWAAGVDDGPAEGVAATPDNLAYVIYTSGSTGRPKGVCVSHRNLLNLVHWHREASGVSARDRVTQVAGTSFDASVLEIWPYLTAGASLHLLPDEELRLLPERLRDWLVSVSATVAFLPTPLAEQVMPLSWPREAALSTLLTGGDKLRRRPPRGLPFEVVDNYGPTECTVVSTVSVVGPADADDAPAPSIGRPVANARAYVLDRGLRPVPAGVTGELYVGGAGVARGYHARPALTAERFIPDPFSDEPGARLYQTGDLARHRADGELEFLGRADGQLKVRGFRVETGEIEAALAAHPSVDACAVVTREDAQGRASLVACVAARAAGAAGATTSLKDELRALTKSRLPDYMTPSSWVFLEALPLTPNGKVDRRALRELARETESPREHVAPRTAAEEALAKVWSEALGVARVGATDDFFELGGHSLLATQVSWKIREAFGVELPLRALFEHSTIASLAALVESERAGAKSPAAPAIVPVARDRFRATLPAQSPAEPPEVLRKN